MTTFYRVGDTSMPYRKTADDVINFEVEELGNGEMDRSTNHEILALIPAHKCKWVFAEKQAARRWQAEYPDDELETCYYDLPVILAMDDDGGFLVCEMATIIEAKGL